MAMQLRTKNVERIKTLTKFITGYQSNVNRSS